MAGQFENPDHWDETAKHYARTAHPFTARFAEAALARVPLGADDRVLDVACGTGALALAAAETGARVLATDFSAGMVGAVAAAGHPHVEARVMDGQALDLGDASFDAVFSIFGVMMFPDWRKGLREMARVTRPGGHGVVATWRDEGAATFLLLNQVRRALFPGRAQKVTFPEGMLAMADPDRLVAELALAGYRDAQVEYVTHDFELPIAALDEPDTMFGASPDWIELTDAEREAVLAEVRRRAGDAPMLAIPSTALIATGVR